MTETYIQIKAPKHLIDPEKYFQAIANQEIREVIKKSNDSYLHWRELKYKGCMPDDWDKKEEIWSLIKTHRLFQSKITPIKDENGNFFRMNSEKYSQFLHIIDKEMAGNYMGIKDFTENDQKSYISRNLVEESISSSLLEGANTSRKVAEKMLTERSKPLNYG